MTCTLSKCCPAGGAWSGRCPGSPGTAGPVIRLDALEQPDVPRDSSAARLRCRESGFGPWSAGTGLPLRPARCPRPPRLPRERGGLPGCRGG
jgi:hypothetical protein